MKNALILTFALTLSALGWAEPQQQTNPQVVQTAQVQVSTPQPGSPRLVKAPAEKPQQQKAPEIQFRDFLTARDAYPSR